MRGAPRYRGFLLLALSVSLLSIGSGAWLFWLSGARQLIVVGTAMFLLIIATSIWWRGLREDEQVEDAES